MDNAKGFDEEAAANRGTRAVPGTGEVKGSGAGAGGGNSEDYDVDPHSGSAAALTGQSSPGPAEGDDKASPPTEGSPKG